MYGLFLLGIPILFYIYHNYLIKKYKRDKYRKRTFRRELYHSNKNCFIMIHGTTGNSNNYNNIIERVRSDCHYILYDLYGRGLSTYPYTEHGTDLYVDQLNDIVVKNSNKNIYLIGYSFGAIIAQEYKNKYPDKIQSLLLIAPAGIHMNIGWIFEFLCKLPLFMLMPISEIFGKYLVDYHKYRLNSKDTYTNYNCPMIASSIRNINRQSYLYSKKDVHTIIYGKKDTVVGRIDNISKNIYIVDSNHSDILHVPETIKIVKHFIDEMCHKNN